MIGDIARGRLTKHDLPGVLIGAVSGALIGAVCVGLWAVIATLLSRLDVSPATGFAVLTGLILGATMRLVGRAGIKRIVGVAGGGFAAALVWLFASGLRPLGIDSISGWGILGATGTWLLAAWIMDTVSRGVPTTEKLGNDIVYASVSVLRAFGFIFFIAIVVFPFYYMLAASLKSRAVLLQDPSNLAIDFSQGLRQLFVGYIEVVTRFHFGRYILNSAFVAVVTVVVTLIPAILGAYAVTRLHFRGRNMLSRSILLIYMFPAIVLVIPLYSVFSQIGLRNTLPGLLIVYPAMTIPVALYMLRSYFQSLPKDIEEAGLIDGCSRFEIIWRIVLPLSVPALASVGLYVFMIAWNEFLFAFMFLDSPEIFTLSRGVVSLNSQEVPRQYLMAGAVIITVPVMVLFFWFERFLVGGLTAGGVKG
ncbi:MAG: carbohydrate ABC transporter permease [Spirochaetaceae bacterium]|nr:carbohydrate ABC transporter permease [Spirochaetaceae bacterium]